LLALTRATQAYKHVVGIAATSADGIVNDHGWNEVSGRYVEFDYGRDIWRGPGEWRGPPEKGKSKQGSTEGTVSNQLHAAELYRAATAHAFRHYNALLAMGVCREQARSVLPLSLMTEWYWSLSLGEILRISRPGAR